MKNWIKTSFLLLVAFIVVLSGCTVDDPGFVSVTNEPNVRVVDSNSNIITIDEVTRGIVAVDYAHHELHEGSAFVVSDVQNINSATVKWMLTTPDTAEVMHVIFDLEGTGEIFMVVTEGADRVGGTALAEINRDRNAGIASDLIVTRAPGGGTTDGATTIYSRRVGATGQGSKTISGGGVRGSNEYLLARNTKYIVSVTTFANIFVSFDIDWYEHTPLD